MQPAHCNIDEGKGIDGKINACEINDSEINDSEIADAPSDADLEALIVDLNGVAPVQARAMRTAQRLPLESRLRLAELDQQQFQRLRRQMRWTSAKDILLLQIPIAMFVLAWHRPGTDDYLQLVLVLNVLSGIVRGLFYSRRLKRFPFSARHNMTILLDEIEDKRIIPIALDRLDNRSTAGTKRTLSRLLPQLRAGEAGTWTRKQKQTLVALLKQPIKDPELTLAAVKALQQVGDETAFEAMRQLAEIRHDVPILFEDVTKLFHRPQMSRNMAMIQQAAQTCLPYLEIRANEQRQAQTLLRASDATVTAAPETLLRPASGLPETAPHELLRPK